MSGLVRERVVLRKSEALVNVLHSTALRILADLEKAIRESSSQLQLSYAILCERSTSVSLSVAEPTWIHSKVTEKQLANTILKLKFSVPNARFMV